MKKTGNLFLPEDQEYLADALTSTSLCSKPFRTSEFIFVEKKPEVLLKEVEKKSEEKSFYSFPDMTIEFRSEREVKIVFTSPYIIYKGCFVYKLLHGVNSQLVLTNIKNRNMSPFGEETSVGWIPHLYDHNYCYGSYPVHSHNREVAAMALYQALHDFNETERFKEEPLWVFIDEKDRPYYSYFYSSSFKSYLYPASAKVFFEFCDKYNYIPITYEAKTFIIEDSYVYYKKLKRFLTYKYKHRRDIIRALGSVAYLLGSEIDENKIIKALEKL